MEIGQPSSDLRQAVSALSALAQETRLAVFRLLVREGPNGIAAGAVAARLGVTPATLSFHLAQLERAGLVTARRQSRRIFYAVDLAGSRRLVAFLTEDCCQGRPELCGGLSDRVTHPTAPPAAPPTPSSDNEVRHATPRIRPRVRPKVPSGR